MSPPEKPNLKLVKQPVKADPIFGARPRHELEFLPAALEVIESPPPPLPRISALALVGLLITALTWATFGKVDVVATAPGRLVPNGGSKVVQPLEAGTVTAIRVHDGMTVRKGDVLVELEPTETLANRTRSGGELAAAQLEVARLRTVALGVPFKAPPNSDPDATMIAQRQARAEIEDREAKLQGLSDQISEHRAALEGVRAEVDRLKTLLPLAEQRSKVFQTLTDRGYGSTLQLIEAHEKQQDTAKMLEVQQRRIPELQAQIAAAQRARAQAEADASKASLAALTEAQVKAASLAEELNKAVERLKGRTLTAPADGAVQELAIHTVGGVVEPGQTLMRIAPAAGQVEVESKLANQDIGFVRTGMPAEVKVQTFPFTRYGVLHATVVSVSRDALTEAKTQDSASTDTSSSSSNDSLHYMMRLRLHQDTMNIDGKTVQLTPGMMVTAEIKTGRRRVIDFLVSPLAKAAEEAGRER
ncbi:MAG: HlyD family type I secretion periplasmic adaptor subunit [Caulobacteraceae bacterium]|nr:HlyD family type I secretion periplasmic adaptor subunit [Caulobacteraceae bacterium]